MLTSRDIKLLIETFKTRAEADEDLRKLREEMATKDMLREVMTKLDAVYKELKDMRLEQDMHVQMHRDIREELDSLKSSIHSS
ncbi:hypothetical protein A3B45_04045 [Candidatus Daviesbacteria bacterium RIFCSPLOWO2_01_FULL_39_12]|uniref:Uncharacterized protein n=1 Tax=Candidatus Daviesbacteria bacterium RIFCSPLOWO2_01_FULL_39_12 TaxID=1797785 RepID=A0A1F5KSF1_9BACT|nr:MAG: hypothetical protein A3D79_01120 [Candidatus Daviesbacteria bacterium RIFCSPHIGHO2_02_FULL_39_8]OGE43750.1 MAG: hypothetical protein A3B45_04045 [Candidatus Daviesbacteria bacterium RIFCSPLOWO2_01_FULL_39_12]